MTVQQAPTARMAEGSSISVRVAVLAWMVAWLASSVLGAIVFGVTGHGGDSADEVPAWVMMSATAAGWAVMLVVLYEVSRQYGSGSIVDDHGVRFRPIDLVGVPIGIACQIGLLRLVYWPLREAWPKVFSDERLERNARDLWDSATGGWVVPLVVLLAVGAPFVEELVYRGLLQGAIGRRVKGVVAVLVVAAWFALVHLRPVEYPGLFAFGLVLGWCALSTGRLGLPMVTHLAFNATGLFWVATR
jgi:uncharacterized protein